MVTSLAHDIRHVVEVVSDHTQVKCTAAMSGEHTGLFKACDGVMRLVLPKVVRLLILSSPIVSVSYATFNGVYQSLFDSYGEVLSPTSTLWIAKEVNKAS